MVRKGRKPLGAAHVEHLHGTRLAKRRLEMILKTIRGEITVGEACQALSIGESRFHALRNQWLQESVELLEPRPTGRPRRLPEVPNAEQVAALESEIQRLRQELMVAEVREEVGRVMPHVVHDSAWEKKGRAYRRRAR
jgi:hypothetical protein